jgi:hypothetical protein
MRDRVTKIGNDPAESTHQARAIPQLSSSTTNIQESQNNFETIDRPHSKMVGSDLAPGNFKELEVKNMELSSFSSNGEGSKPIPKAKGN